MASNDPTDTGGLFIGRRPGTGPLRYRVKPIRAGGSRQRADSALAAVILAGEAVLCISLFGPQPAGWMWVGSHVEYQTGFVTAGIMTIFVGMLFSLFTTLALAKRLDYAWRIVRRAAGHDQQRGALERIFVVSAVIAVTVFAAWFFLLAGQQPIVAPRN
jgi:hypothetical protein